MTTPGGSVPSPDCGCTTPTLCGRMIGKRERKPGENETRFDHGPGDPDHAALCPAYDFGQHPTAVLQLGGYLDCRAVYQHRRVGGCGQRLHPDDLFDLPDFGHVYGGRGAVLHQLRRQRPASAGGVHRLRFCAHCGADGGAHRGLLRPVALHFAVDAHAGGRVPHDVFLRPGDFGGTALHLPLQLFCLPPAGGGKLPGASGVFGGEHGAEHRPGCAAGGGHPLWRGGSCGGHCNRSRRGRRGHRLF